jgi:tRNA(fMet)-specific endonuclease VapC
LILLDSNVLIHYLKGMQPLTSRLQAASPRDLAVPSIVAYELEYGSLRTANPRLRKMLDQVLKHLEEIPFDAAAARSAAQIRVELEQAGATIGPLDLLIAGTAVSRSATLVTNNVAEFARVAGLRLEDWSK